MDRLLHVFLPQLSITASYCKEGFVGLLSCSLDSLKYHPPLRHPALILSAQSSEMSRHGAEAVCRPPAYHSPQGVNQQGVNQQCAAAMTDLCEGNLLMNLDCASRLSIAPTPKLETQNLQFYIIGLKKTNKNIWETPS
ncbi:hypothetical protein NQZ68_007098 [Dissostichus eleginoides]|nr:hypothetical protein NQZ68_007098 [Dissostichus eleginoides]